VLHIFIPTGEKGHLYFYKKIKNMKKIILNSLILFFFVLFNSPIKAQTYEELSKSFWDFIDKKDYLSAIPYGEKSIKQAEKEFGKNSDTYLSETISLGLAYEGSQDYKNAFRIYSEAISLIEKEHNGVHDFYYKMLKLTGDYLRSEGRNKESEFIYLKALSVCGATLGENDVQYAVSLNDLGFLYNALGNFEGSETLFIRALGIYEVNLGENSQGFAITLNNLSELYISMGLNSKAEPLMIKASEVFKNILGENSVEYARSLRSLAGLNRGTGKFTKSELLYLQSSEIILKIFGNKHQEYAYVLRGLSVVYLEKGEYKKSEQSLQEAQEIIRINYSENHIEYIGTLDLQYVLYAQMGNYVNAKKIALNIVERNKQLEGESSPSYALSLFNLAEIYASMGDYANAERIHLKVLDIRLTILGKKHQNYAVSLNSLGQIYLEMGNYVSAEPYFVSALEIIKNTFGVNHEKYAHILLNLSALYFDLGNLEKSSQFSIQALTSLKSTLGEFHPHYAEAVNRVALLMEEYGKYVEAERYFKLAASIYKNSLNGTNAGYLAALNNLSNLYRKTGKKLESIALNKEILDLRKQELGDNHPYYAISLCNSASLFSEIGEYPIAESYYKEAIKIFKDVFGENSRLYMLTLEDLFTISTKMGNQEKAFSLIPILDSLLLSNIQNNFTFLSESEKEKYISTQTSTFNSHKSFYLAYYPKKTETSTHFYNIELATKSIILKATTEMRKTIENNGDTSIIKKYDEWRNFKNYLAKQYLLPTTERDENFAEYEEKVRSLEKDLLRFSNSYNKTKSIEHNIHWQDVQAALKDDEAAIEFSSFQYHDGKRWCDSTMYVALVLRKSNPYPTMIPLFEARQLDSLLQKKGVKDAIFIDDLYQSNQGSKLYNLLWSPLEASLKGVSKISFSASGLLHQVSFAALTDKIGQNLTDKYLLNQVNTTALIAIKDDKATDSPKSIALFGGIDYNASAESRLIAAKAFQKETNTSSNSFTLAESSSRGEQWNYLAGTKREVETINTLASSKKLNTTVYLKQNALEEAFNNLQGENSPDIIHIATHGFFFPDLPQEKPKDDFIEIEMEKDQKFRKASNPLMRSGLLMAGANDAWSGKETTNGLEDGILTAYEAANIPIPNTQLVVLSACETGLGDIKGNEGVVGLQRAFQTAGAKYVLMSLWKIPDSETAEFMILFYETMFSGKSIPEAFRVTQLEMSKKYKNEPYKWAAFVLIGG
jgi:CHAT domain-containing protein